MYKPELIYKFSEWDNEIISNLQNFIHEFVDGNYYSSATFVDFYDRELNDIVPYCILQKVKVSHLNKVQGNNFYKFKMQTLDDNDGTGPGFKWYAFDSMERSEIRWSQIELYGEEFSLNFMLQVPAEIRQYMVRIYNV